MYTRHKPLLAEILDSLIKGRLKEQQFPYMGDHRLADRLGVCVYQSYYEHACVCVFVCVLWEVTRSDSTSEWRL